MKHMVGYRDRIRTYALAHGQRPARLGPSPGFSNLKWLKPVYAGDTITYRSTVTAKRASASRPGWGLVFHHNTATNQHGEEVFAFDGMVFWEGGLERSLRAFHHTPLSFPRRRGGCFTFEVQRFGLIEQRPLRVFESRGICGVCDCRPASLPGVARGSRA